MKNLKFRAWNESVKKMTHFGDLVLTGDWENKMGMFFKAIDGTVYMSKYSDPMQFTGLKDKNGVDIYEGDIVKAANQGQRATCEVKWGQGRVGFFLFREQRGICWSLSGGGDDYCQETVEVVGNIYENSDLLTTKPEV